MLAQNSTFTVCKSSHDPLQALDRALAKYAYYTEQSAEFRSNGNDRLADGLLRVAHAYALCIDLYVNDFGLHADVTGREKKLGVLAPR